MATTNANRVVRILGELDRLLVDALDPMLRGLGLGREHWQILRLLEDGNGHAMGELSQALGLPGATSTRVVDALVSSTLVYRRSDPLDRRRVLVLLADPGREVLRQVERALSCHISRILARSDGEQSSDLLHLLDRLLETTSD
jgi:DNA-binding MarR family transcriptional regulator